MLLGDGLLAVAVSLHHRVRHQRAQQPLVFGALLGDLLMLDGEIAAHLIEGGGELAELVAGFDGQGDAVVADADPSRPVLQAPDRADEDP